MIDLQFIRTHPNAKRPTRAHPTDAGLDFYALEDATLYVGQRVAVDTGIAVAIPTGHVGKLYGRSSLGANHGVTLANAVGIIDADYRGSIVAVLANHGQVPYYVHAGDRIAQLVVEPIVTPTVVEVEALPGTVRGSGGFGSSGR